jgi:predicted PurR-regulated permease PerM
VRTVNTALRDRYFGESGRLPGLLFFAGAVLLVAIFYWTRAILIPLALSILLTFLLAPLVTRLQRWGINRGFSVTIAVLFTLLLLGGMLWLAALQVRNLADELPRYRANIRQKIGDLRNFSKGGALEKFDRFAGEVRKELNKDAARPMESQKAPAAPAPVEPSFSWDDIKQPLASGGFVLLLLIYMLAQREELRNRLIRLAGYGNLSITTQALEELGKRISNYLSPYICSGDRFLARRNTA